MKKLLKIVVSISLLALAAYYLGVEDILSYLKKIEPIYFFVAFLLAAIQALIVARRWHLILKLISSPPGFLTIIRAQLLALYASLFLPNIISGTAVKAALMKPEGIPVTRTVISIALDKVLATTTLVLVATAGLPLLAQKHVIARELEKLPTALILLLCVFVATCAMLFVLSRYKLDYFRRIVYIYRHQKLEMALLLLWQAAAVLIGIAQYWVLFGFEVDPFGLLMTVPTAMFFASLPISIGGWGVREGSSVLLLSLIGVPSAHALLVSIQVGIAGTLVSLLGAFFWSHDILPKSKKLSDIE